MNKVVHVIDGLGWAGMEQMVKELVLSLDKKLFHVVLLSEMPMKESVREQVAMLKKNDVEVIFLQEEKARRFVALDYAKIFKKLRPRIVHSHSGVWRDCCLGAVMASVPALFHTEHGRVFLDDNIRARLTHRILSRFRTRVIAVSDELKTFLREQVGLPENKLITIYNGVDTQKFTPGKHSSRLRKGLGMTEEDVFVAAVGRITPVKDYETMVRAVHETKKRLDSRGFKLLIAGPETYDKATDSGTMGRLKELSKELDIEDQVVFLGKRDDIPALLSEADIFVQTSVTEGLSMAILEAMASALPVVATNVGGNGEIIDHGSTGYLVEPGNPKSVAGALTELIQDKPLRERMGKNGREKVLKGFSLEHMTRKYEELYRSAS